MGAIILTYNAIKNWMDEPEFWVRNLRQCANAKGLNVKRNNNSSSRYACEVVCMLYSTVLLRYRYIYATLTSNTNNMCTPHIVPLAMSILVDSMSSGRV